MVLSSAGYKKEEPTSHPPPKAVDMLERLRAMYPTANAGLVQDILTQANYDEKGARAQLAAIGYKAQYTPTHKTTIDTSSKRTVSPARATSPKRASPAKPAVSEAQKAKVLAKLKGQYKDYEESVIAMALQVCDYDETRVKAILDRMHEDSEAPRPSSSRPGTSTSRERSPSPTPVISSGSLDPVAFDVEQSFVDRSKKPTSSSSSSSRTTPDRKTPSKSSRTPTPKSSASATRQQQRTKNVTDHRRQEAVVSRQPVAAGSSHVSEFRTIAKGPDPSLCVGPNTDLLLKEYALAKGPNPDMRHGPDRSLVMGPQGAVGPDRNLWSGPQLHLLQGTSSENRLVTAI